MMSSTLYSCVISRNMRWEPNLRNSSLFEFCSCNLYHVFFRDWSFQSWPTLMLTTVQRKLFSCCLSLEIWPNWFHRMGNSLPKCKIGCSSYALSKHSVISRLLILNLPMILTQVQWTLEIWIIKFSVFFTVWMPNFKWITFDQHL